MGTLIRTAVGAVTVYIRCAHKARTMPLSKFFFIKSKMSEKVLDIQGSCGDEGTPVVLYDQHGADNQLWYVDHVKGVIRSKLNDMCLEVNHDNRLQISELKDHPFNEQFTLSGDDRIQHTIFKDRVFDVVGANCDNEAEVCTWEWHGGDNQKWEFEHIEPTYFMIVSDMND